MKKKPCLFLPALFCSLLASAQTPAIDSIEAKQIIFSDSMQVVRSERRQLNYTKYKNIGSVIKLSLLAPLYGNLTLHYEQRLTSAFSIEAGGGISFKDSQRKLSSSGELVAVTSLNPNVPVVHVNSNTFDDLSHRKFATGYTFSAEPKYYFERKGLQGIFVGLQFAHTKHNIKSDRINLKYNSIGFNPDYIADTFTEKTLKDDFQAVLGNQVLYKHISLEYALSGGLRKTTFTKYVYEYISTNNFADGYAELKTGNFIFQAQLKVGYHF